MSSAGEVIAASGAPVERPDETIVYHSNIVVIDPGLNAPKPITLTPEEAKGMGDPEPDAGAAAAADRLRHGRLGYCAIKRLFDIAFSLLVIVLFSWLFLLTAIAIKIDDPSGPVFFGQDRVGRDGKHFRMWKFRSMCADAEAKLAELQAKNEKDGPVFKTNYHGGYTSFMGWSEAWFADILKALGAKTVRIYAGANRSDEVCGSAAFCGVEGHCGAVAVA